MHPVTMARLSNPHSDRDERPRPSAWPGDLVLWRDEPDSEVESPAMVIRTGERGRLDVAVFVVGATNVLPRSGVLNEEDPDCQFIDRRTEGVWRHRSLTPTDHPYRLSEVEEQLTDAVLSLRTRLALIEKELATPPRQPEPPPFVPSHSGQPPGEVAGLPGAPLPPPKPKPLAKK